MSKPHNKIISNDISRNLPQDKRLWNQIVNATQKVKGDNLYSLRIPLYISLRQEDKRTQFHSGRDVIKVIYSLYRALLCYRKPSLNYMEGNVLFAFPYSSNSTIDNLLPVARLSRDKGLVGNIIAGDNVKPLLNEFTSYPIMTKSDLYGLIGAKQKILSINRAFQIYDELSTIFLLHAPEYSMRLKCRFSEIIEQIYSSLLLSISFRKLFQYWSPSCVISTSDFWPFEYQLNYQAALNSIPTLVLQHGILNHFWWPFVSDYYCVWGQMFYDEMRRIGAPENRLLICGMPSSDELFKKYINSDLSGSSIRSCLILSHTQLRESAPSLYEKYSVFLEELISSSPHIKWLIKLHPRENDVFYKDILSKFNQNLTILPKSVSLENACKEADVACTIWSTSGLEAMVMNKPLIIFDIMPNVREFAWWPNYGGGIYAKTPFDFMNVLSRLQESAYLEKIIRSQKEFINECFANKGYAAETILKILERYCSRYSYLKTAG